jgi:hypothetical protein
MSRANRLRNAAKRRPRTSGVQNSIGRAGFFTIAKANRNDRPKVRAGVVMKVIISERGGSSGAI